ncbi:hypothetical protein [Aeromonas media]|uniref:hypothetical protein n=1 Tax=Aeromonas media TaxID=651 RepID=UPI003D250DC7
MVVNKSVVILCGFMGLTLSSVSSAMTSDEYLSIAPQVYGYYGSGVGSYKCNEFYSQKFKDEIDTYKKDYEYSLRHAERKLENGDAHEYSLLSKVKMKAEMAALDDYDALYGSSEKRCKDIESGFYSKIKIQG